jgi:hypothetical protein
MIERRDVTRSLHTAREIFSPTSEQHERVRAALRARLALEAGSEARGTDSAARAAVRRGRVLTLAKSGALIGIGFALGYWFAEIRADGEDVSSAVSRAVEERAGAATMLLDSARSLDGGLLLDGGRGPRGVPPESPRAAPTASVASGAAAPRRRPRAHPGREAQRAAPASRSEELSLLQRAERAIRAADGALARSFIAELDARFPKTTWREERSAILVLAACALEEPGAESDAREFLRRHTASVYFDRIQMFCRQGATTPSANGMTVRETGGPSSDTHRAEENP